jgi:hypothetical protein
MKRGALTVRGTNMFFTRMEQTKHGLIHEEEDNNNNKIGIWAFSVGISVTFFCKYRF